MNILGFGVSEDISPAWLNTKKDAGGTIDFKSGVKAVEGCIGFTPLYENGNSTISNIGRENMTLENLDPDRAKIVHDIWTIAHNALAGEAPLK